MVGSKVGTGGRVGPFSVGALEGAALAVWVGAGTSDADYEGKDDEIRIVVENPVNHIGIDHLPPTDRMLVARDGALWMERSDLDAEPWVRELRHIVRTIAEQPNTVWDIFDSSGLYRATVELPAKFRPGQVAVDWIAGVQPDELDVEYVVRYRIVGGE